jgi:hypothetical protein
MRVDSAGCSDFATGRPARCQRSAESTLTHAERRTTSWVSSVTPRGEAPPS